MYTQSMTVGFLPGETLNLFLIHAERNLVLTFRILVIIPVLLF